MHTSATALRRNTLLEEGLTHTLTPKHTHSLSPTHPQAYANDNGIQTFKAGSESVAGLHSTLPETLRIDARAVLLSEVLGLCFQRSEL
jgi:hypothetical protein